MGAISEIDVYENQEALVAGSETLDVRYPLISHHHSIVGDEPVIAGTRVTVRAIVEYDRLHNDSERTLRALPHVSLAQIQDALGYYHDHPVEIERLIAENEDTYDAGASKV